MYKTVVVIDDCDIDRYLVRRAIERSGLGAEVIEYGSASNAFPDFGDSKRFADVISASPPPVLVLLDINMPEMNGFEFLARLDAENAATDHIAVSICTSSGSPEERERALAHDCVIDFVVKPITPEKLQELARRPEFAA